MKIRVLLILGFALLCSVAVAQTSGPENRGIRIVETKEKSHVYEVKLADNPSEPDMQFLVQRFREKKGVLSADFNLSEQLCSVEAVLKLDPKYLEDVVNSCGLRVSKSFNE
jgi:hypothetical protein